MKKSDIPQDESALKNFTREVFYAKNKDGKYETGLSIGWDVKKEALDGAWDEINRNVAEAKRKVAAGEVSPIYFYMEVRLMDIHVLASYVGFWKWRIKRHFKPTIFNQLNDKILIKYANVFEITLEELKNIDQFGEF